MTKTKDVQFIADMCQCLADQIRKMLSIYGLDGVKGSGVMINIISDDVIDYRSVMVGDEQFEHGMIYRTKESGSNEWKTAKQFASGHKVVPECGVSGSGAQEGKPGEKPLPPDGLWLSVYDDYHPLDCGV